jgi:hypothetical protein
VTTIVRASLALAAITLALGACVVASWVLFGGRTVFTGPGAALRAGGWWIFVVQAALAAAVGFAVDRRAEWAPSWLIAAALVGAWLVEGILLGAFGWILADELEPPSGIEVWWLATGGPAQPAAAVAGALVARRTARKAT